MVLLVLAALKIEQPKPNPKLKTGNESCEDKLFGSSDLLFLSQQLSKCSLSFVLDKHHAKAEDMARGFQGGRHSSGDGKDQDPKAHPCPNPGTYEPVWFLAPKASHGLGI